MILKRFGKVTTVLFVLWALTMLWVLDKRVNFTHRTVKDWGDCPCMTAAGAGKASPSADKKPDEEAEPKVKTRTVVKWLNYCKDGNGTKGQSDAKKSGEAPDKKGSGGADGRSKEGDRPHRLVLGQVPDGKAPVSHEKMQPLLEVEKGRASDAGQAAARVRQAAQQKALGRLEPTGSAVNPHPYRFALANADACVNGAGDDGTVDVLCLVYTAPSDSYMRSLIRKTWASTREVGGKRIVTMFLLGQRNPEVQQLIELENQLYRDIIQENFIDSYYNLTYKTVMGLRWASTYCANARFIVKMDIDMFVNVYNLVQRIETAPTEGFAEGNRKGVSKPLRNKHSKWYTSLEVYPAETYPPYLNGPAYLMSWDLAPRIYRMSYHTRFLPWEDAFVGIIMDKISVDPKYNDRYDTYLNYRNEEETLKKISHSITFHLGEDKNQNKVNIVNVWKYLQKINNVTVTV